jgi:polyhydroxybutyrate depolymerase
MNIAARLLLILLIGLPTLAFSAPADGLQTLALTVDGVERTALVYVPSTATPGNLPLVFVFHGHGGTARNAVNSFGINRLWPEAISVYPQGVNTVSKLTDPQGVRSGWQKAVGDNGDRDLHFFDALLAHLKQDYPVDPKRIYCTGHSNGGGFTYLLWLARPGEFAAVAPCSSAAPYTPQLTAKPALIAGGRNDALVKFEWQQMEVDALRKVNGCAAVGVPWQESAATIYPSKGGTPLVTYFYDGGHAMDPTESGLIVKFFQEHPGAAVAVH